MIDPNSPAPIRVSLLGQVSEEKLVEFKSKSKSKSEKDAIGFNRTQDCTGGGPLEGIGNDEKGL